MVRIRQLLDAAKHRLLVVPLIGVLIAFGLSQVMLQLDQAIADENIPRILDTTVESARSILSAISAGLISSVTLLLSMMLVAVQLASSQFSPRTVRDWTGDRTQQVSIAVVLGTAIYCLLILRETRSFGEGDELVPHLSVLLALALGVVSLVGVVRSVDHLTNSMRIGSVANSIMTQTTALIADRSELVSAENPAVVPVSLPARDDREIEIPAGAYAVTSTKAGWIQQLDIQALFEAIPDQCTAYATVPLGTFAPPHIPLVWIWPAPEENCDDDVRAAIAIGDTRTMQQDVGYGILQLIDIALRALSPGVNDPNTANDVIAHLGVILLALWEQPQANEERTDGNRTLLRRDLTHDDYLTSVVEPLRTYAMTDRAVIATIVRMLLTLKHETIRRELPGPLDPIDHQIDILADATKQSALLDRDKSELLEFMMAR